MSGQAGPAASIHAGNVMNWLKTNGQRKEGRLSRNGPIIARLDSRGRD